MITTRNMRLFASVLSVGVYSLVIALLMYANTVHFNLGDSKPGEAGWTVYWYRWTITYLPIYLFGVVLNWFKNDVLKEYVKCNFVLILLLSLFVELSFIYDVAYPLVIIQYVIIAIVWVYVLRLKRYLTKRFGR